MARSSRAAHQRVQAPLAQPGTEHDLPSWGQRHADVLVVVVTRGKREVSKEGERLLHEHRDLRGADPGGEIVQKALQRLLVGLDGGTVGGALEECGDELEHERVVGGVRVCHGGSPSPVMMSSRGYSTPLPY